MHCGVSVVSTVQLVTCCSGNYRFSTSFFCSSGLIIHPTDPSEAASPFNVASLDDLFRHHGSFAASSSYEGRGEYVSGADYK